MQNRHGNIHDLLQPDMNTATGYKACRGIKVSQKIRIADEMTRVQSHSIASVVPAGSPARFSYSFRLAEWTPLKACEVNESGLGRPVLRQKISKSARS
jgi:hypothetical protein